MLGSLHMTVQLILFPCAKAVHHCIKASQIFLRKIHDVLLHIIGSRRLVLRSATECLNLEPSVQCFLDNLLSHASVCCYYCNLHDEILLVNSGYYFVIFSITSRLYRVAAHLSIVLLHVFQKNFRTLFVHPEFIFYSDIYLTATTPRHLTQQLNDVTSIVATQLSHFLTRFTLG